MKRRTLLDHLQEHGCVPFREGGSQSIWQNPQTGRKEAIPRHTKIKKFLARSAAGGKLPLPKLVWGGRTGRRKFELLATDETRREHGFSQARQG